MNNYMTPNAAAYNNPQRLSRLIVEGVEISGDCLWEKATTFPVGTLLFLDESYAIHADPQVLGVNPPEVQLLGQVVNEFYIYVTPRRLPVLI